MFARVTIFDDVDLTLEREALAWSTTAGLRISHALPGYKGLLTLIDRGTISGAIAKGVFEKMFSSGRSAADIVEAEGLTQIDDADLLAGQVAEVLRANQDAVAQYRAGKTTALGFLVGQVMKATGGKANPKRVNDLLKKELGTG